MSCCINWPIVFSVSLFTWSKVSMSLSIHLSYILPLFFLSSHRIQYLLRTLRPNRRHPKWIIMLIINLLIWPVIVSLIALPQWFLHLTCVLVFLNLIELISKSCQVLCLNHCVNVVWSVGFLPIGKVVGDWLGIIDHAWMDLFDTWLVLETFSVLANVLGCAWDVL